jgi:hypothetical protein
VYPSYQRVLGISSIRLELHFGKKKVTIRGIAAIADAQKAIAYLKAQCSSADALVSYTHKGENVDTGWSGTGASGISGTTMPKTETQFELPTYHSIDPVGPITEDFSLQERAQAPTDKVETPSQQRSHQEQRERRQKRLHRERTLREHGFDVEKLAQRLQEEALPEVSVPLRLLPDEHAHYTTEATLCGEPIGGTIRYTYPAKDHGTLILTNKRLIYMGRRNQLVLDYARLLHISRLRSAIAVEAEHWHKREIFEMHRPLECVMYLEAILMHRQHSSLAV